jgi:hypothetical protein
MIASEIVAQRKQSNVDRHPPLAAIVSMPRPVVTSVSAETRQLAAIARRVGTFSAAQPCERSSNNFIGVARVGPTTPKPIRGYFGRSDTDVVLSVKSRIAPRRSLDRLTAALAITGGGLPTDSGMPTDRGPKGSCEA